MRKTKALKVGLVLLGLAGLAVAGRTLSETFGYRADQANVGLPVASGVVGATPLCTGGECYCVENPPEKGIIVRLSNAVRCHI